MTGCDHGAMPLAVAALVAGVLAYGFSGLHLASGSREDRHALRSGAWWLGTGLQGVGFVFTFLARGVLPLLLVQSAIAAGLAVTAVLEHVTGRRRLTGVGAVSVSAVVLGICAIGAAVQTGPAPTPRALDVLVLGGLALACALAIPWARGAAVNGMVSGVAFGVGAVAARLLVGSAPSLLDLLRFWQWSPTMWAVAAFMPIGIVLGQWALTRGLASGPSVAALGGDYLLATVAPSAIGILLLGEHLRPQTAPLAVIGALAAGAGLRSLLRVAPPT